MDAEIRPGTRVGEGMQILHVERASTVILVAVWGGEVTEMADNGDRRTLTDYFGTLRLAFSDEELAKEAEPLLTAWCDADTRILLRYHKGRYASVTDPETGLRVASGRIP